VAINPFNPGYYYSEELRTFGFRAVGEHVAIAKNCTIVGVENISLGSHVRIDGYSTLVAAGDGWLRFGSYIHVGCQCVVIAGDGVEMDDFSCISHGVKLFSRSDDYSGQHMANATVPDQYKSVQRGTVRLSRHALIGAGSVVLPGVVLGEGAAVGALSLVNKSLEAWGIYGGCPARRLKARSKAMLDLEAMLHSEELGDRGS
jgi:galactoside O-acetyltransferase